MSQKTFKTTKGTELPLTNLRGKDYLEVKYRLVWFREERPTWSIETDFVSLDKESAMGRAVIKDDTGRIIATAHKCEDKKGFQDFAEKAETGSIGRALALIGYGTQFAPEIEEDDRIVDSPVTRQPTIQNVTFVDEDGGQQVKPKASNGATPICCDNPMMLSKFTAKGFGDLPPWYCGKCKSKRIRE